MSATAKVIRQFATLGAVALVLLYAATPAMADLLAYEPFIGTNEADLAGQSTGGSGFSGSWAGTAGMTQIYNNNTGVTYTDSLGSALVQSGYCLGVYGAKTGMSDLVRNLTTPVPDTGTYYISGVFHNATFGPHYWGIGLPNSDANLGLAKVGESTSAWQFESWNDSSGPRSDAVMNRVATAFLVGKIVKNEDGSGDDTLTLWVNPILGNESASGEGFTEVITGTGDDVYPSMSIVCWTDLTSVMGYVADVRLGTTFADVTPFTPAPEPSTLTLVVLGMVSRSFPPDTDRATAESDRGLSALRPTAACGKRCRHTHTG